MAVRGNGYTKTTWAFEERPVTSAKLNSWDDRVETALELIHFLLAHAWGGGDGVIRGVTTDDLNVIATAPEGFSVTVQPGYAFISKFPFKLAASFSTASVTPPVTDPRIDLVQARLDLWEVNIKTGTEAATPTSPSPDADSIGLGQLFLRTGMTSIKNVDDGTNGYIIDVRSFL